MTWVSELWLTKTQGIHSFLFRSLSSQNLAIRVIPVIRIVDRPVDPDFFKEALMSFDRIVFTSVHAVESLLRSNIVWPDQARGVLASAVGRATAESVSSAWSMICEYSSQASGASALLALPSWQALQGLRILIISGANPKRYLSEELRRRGAQVESLVTYERVPADEIQGALWREMWMRQPPPLIQVSSLEVLRALGQSMQLALYHQALPRCALLVVTPVMKEHARQYECFHPVVLAKDPSDAAVLEAIDAFRKGAYG